MSASHQRWGLAIQTLNDRLVSLERQERRSNPEKLFLDSCHCLLISRVVCPSMAAAGSVNARSGLTVGNAVKVRRRQFLFEGVGDMNTNNVIVAG